MMRRSRASVRAMRFLDIAERVLGRTIELPHNVSALTALRYYQQKALVPFLRGLTRAPFLRGVRLPIFVGDGVEIRFASLLTCGKAVSLGDRVRIDALSTRGVVLGNRVTLREGTIIQLTSHLSNLGDMVVIEDDVYIGPNAFIGAGARIRIGQRTLVGPRLTIIAEEHRTDGAQSISDQGVTRSGVDIGHNCWIGACVTILDGVSVGPGSVIGAGSVVTHSLPAGSVAYGVPARVRRSRVPSEPIVGELGP